MALPVLNDKDTRKSKIGFVFAFRQIRGIKVRDMPLFFGGGVAWGARKREERKRKTRVRE